MESKKRGRKLSNMKEFEAELRGTSKQSAALRKKVFSKAKFVPPGSDRKLQNNYNNANANNVDYSAFNYDGAEDANANQNYYQQDGADDYFAVNGVWDNTFGFDPTQYSLSYHRCAEVRQFDDEIAAQEDTTSVFTTKHFAVFRFCPEATCMGYKQDFSSMTSAERAAWEAAQAAVEANQDGVWIEDREIVGARGSGCQSNYGEYMIELQDYLEIMNEYRSERFEQYCTYCQKCMYKVYSVSLFRVFLICPARFAVITHIVLYVIFCRNGCKRPKKIIIRTTTVTVISRISPTRLGWMKLGDATSVRQTTTSNVMSTTLA